MRRLLVYLAGQPVGNLEQDDSGLLEFRYRQDWIDRAGALALSRSLPLQSDTFRGKHARAFFAGILPEEEPRKRIAAILGVSERNDFALLEQIGGECAGAVSLLPEGVRPPATGETRLRELSDDDLQKIVTELPDRPLMAGEDGLRLSLAGAQDKLPVVVRDGRVALPLGNTPSTHIIKPEPLRFPGLVANEFFCMTLAKAVGLKVSAVDRRTVGDKPCLIVQRYDRTVGADGTVTRLHQEDFCQALGYAPEHKYQQEGGPLLRDCIALLREWSTTPVLDIRDFLDGQIFNVLIGNADAHGKNYSLLYRHAEKRLAPLYDLVCTLAWPELSKTPAMKIGNSDSIELITPAHWQLMAKNSRVGWPMLRERIVDVCRRTQTRLQDSDVREAGGGIQTVDRVASIIENRATFLIQSLI